MGNLNSHKKLPLLETVEDSPEYSNILQKIAREAGEQAVREARALKIPITYLNDSRQVVKEFPDGRIEVIEQLIRSETLISLPKGTVLYARKK